MWLTASHTATLRQRSEVKARAPACPISRTRHSRTTRDSRTPVSARPRPSLRERFDHLEAAPVTTTIAHGIDPLDRPRTDAPATRARVKREIVDSYLASNVYARSIVTRTQDFLPLVALRLGIEILRHGRCPTAAELDVPPYSTLRAPSVLGDSIPVTPSSHVLYVDLPAWVRDKIEQDQENRKAPFPPSPPAPKIINLPCP